MIRMRIRSFPFFMALFAGLFGIAWPASVLGQGLEYVKGELHEVRISDSDARRHSALHVGLCPQGPITALSDHAHRGRRTACSPMAPTLTRRTSGLRRSSARTATSSPTRTCAGCWMSEGEFVNMRPHRPQKSSPQDIDESTRYLRHDRLADQARAEQQRKGRAVGISYPGFYTAAGMIDAHPGAQGRLAPGAGDRLVHGRRLASQRRLLPAALPSTSWPRSAIRAPSRPRRSEQPIRPRHARRLRLFPANGPALERQRALFQGRCRRSGTRSCSTAPTTISGKRAISARI